MRAPKQSDSYWGEDDPEVRRMACALSFYYDGDAGDADDWMGGAAAALEATNLRGAADEIVWLRGVLGRIAAGHAHPSKLAGEAVDESVVRILAGGQ
jgi:hypothetical protein